VGEDPGNDKNPFPCPECGSKRIGVHETEGEGDGIIHGL